MNLTRAISDCIRETQVGFRNYLQPGLQLQTENIYKTGDRQKPLYIY